MSRMINLQENEIKLLISNLQLMHRTGIADVRDAINDVKDLANSKHSFQVEKISNKIEDMLDVIDKEVIFLLEQIFQESIKEIDHMIAITLAVDTVSK